MAGSGHWSCGRSGNGWGSHRKGFARVIRALTFFVSIVAVLSALSVLSWASQRYIAVEMCKPVVPQIAVFHGGTANQFRQLHIMYDEIGSSPFSDDGFTKNARHTGCEIVDERCIASRMRYEVSSEGERTQSVQIRGVGGELTEKGNPILGGVRWNGSSYPDRINIQCNFYESDPRKSCLIVGLDYSADPGTSGDDGEEAHIGPHDQCTPAENWFG